MSADAARRAQEREEDEEREREEKREAKKEKKRKAKEAAEKERLEKEKAEAAEEAGESDDSEVKDEATETTSTDDSEELKDEPAELDPAEEEDAEKDEEEQPKPRTRFVFKILGAAIVLFLVWLGYRWVATGKDPDIISEAGQEELLKDLGRDMNKLSKSVSDVGSWGLGELEEMIMGKPPQTEAEIAALMDESKKEMEEEKAEEQKAAPPPTPRKAVKPKTTTRRTSRSTYTKRSSTRSRSKSKYTPDPRLASARRIYQQAISHYLKADPRKGNITQAQQHLKRAKPLFERCLDECTRIRNSGVRHGGLSRLEQQAAMRLYDCNKRLIMR